MSILRLAIPSPLRREFDYLPPAGSTDAQISALAPGTRVRVPFGRREVTGYLLSTHGESPVDPSALKPALEILDEYPVIDPVLLGLCQWAASYYRHPPGEVFSAIFPKRLREGKPVAPPSLQGWQRTDRAMGLPEGALTRSPKQAGALAMFQQHSALSKEELKAADISTAVLRALEEKRLIERCSIASPARAPVSGKGLSLNTEQADALHHVKSAGPGFSCHLLEGVTGSGKTEVYLQLIADCLNAGKQALVLIPEIGLTPQTIARFAQRFDAHIVALHSGISDAQRYRAWEEARSGHAHIVIGTRSAVFTPLHALGLIVVDEEHDSSFKQQDGFRYNARDVAVKRAHMHDCPIVLGSATPSLESIHNVDIGRYQHQTLTQRAGKAQLPGFELLDVRRAPLQAGLSPALIAAVGTALEEGGQVLLFLNRRGFAPSLQCHDCGWVAQCNACDARLTVHRRQRRLRCHHCGKSAQLVQKCAQCHSSALLTSGLGTQQTEDALLELYGKWPIHRVDSDSMQSRDSMQSLVKEINAGDPCILLGTQMLTKGHHFPGVSLVGVIDADALLFSADFRGEERLAQIITQVAGRAGRAEAGGKVMMQTHYPDHPLLQAIVRKSYAELAREILLQRKTTGLPPCGQLIIVRADCRDADGAENFLQRARQNSERSLPPQAQLIGPLPSPMQRRAGKFRAQLMLRAPTRQIAQSAAETLIATAETLKRPGDLKWSIDIDPQDVF